MKNKLITNILKVFLSLIVISLYILIVINIYNTNIWLYKSYVLFMLLIFLIYLIFRIIKDNTSQEEQLVAKVVKIDNINNLVRITYEYLDRLFYYEIDFNEYDQNKYFKYRLDYWYSIIVNKNKVIKVLDPSSEPIIDKKIQDKQQYKKLKYKIHIYIYYIYELLFLINLIIFPVIVVLTNYKINTYIFIIVEVINIILFVINSIILKKD